MALTVEFRKLQTIANDINSKTKQIIDHNFVLHQFNHVIANFIAYCNNFKEDELSMLTISLQTWMNKRNKLTSSIIYNVGDIVYADLGITYKLESSYAHPVIVLEEIGNMVLVAPTTTSQDLINEAFHPLDKTDGNKYLRKVYDHEDNFEKTCVILISNIRTISPGRIVSRLDRLKQSISEDNSLFMEVKNKMFEYYLPRIYLEQNKLKDRIDQKQNEINVLEERVENLESELIEIKRLKKSS